MKLTTKLTILAAAAIGGTTLTGIAIAGTPSADGTITACVKTDGTPRIIDTEAGGTCTSTEKRLAWSSGWRHRGTYDAAKTYAVGDVVVLPKVCGTVGPSFQEGRSVWVKVNNGSTPYCLLDSYHIDSATWRPLSLPPSTPRRAPVQGAAGVRVETTDEGRTDVADDKYFVKLWNYSGIVWINMPGADARKCRVAATALSGDPVVVTRYESGYSEWIALLTQLPSGADVEIPLDVIIDCPVGAYPTSSSPRMQSSDAAVSPPRLTRR